ncbi:24744_t:CDS:2, partial [Racocetra persica]
LNIRDYFLFFILIVATYVFNFYYKYLTRPNPLPGPLPLPFFGNLLNVAFCDTKLFYNKCRLEYGDICEIMLNGRRYELGFYGRGIGANHVYKSWKYNKQFFIQALMVPSFMHTAINSTNKLFEELRKYWQSLGMQNASNNNNNDNWILETDFSEWFHAFTNDIISIITTGERTYSIASYYNTQSTVKSEYPDALVEDGNEFVKSLIKHVESLILFTLAGPFLRHYVPIIRNMANAYLKNRDYLHEKLNLMIKKRRKEIEEMPMGAEMRTDMLTSLIIANTERDTFNAKTVGGETFEPMNDEDIRSNLVEAFGGGTNT